MFIRLCLLFSLLLINLSALAAPMTTEQVPEPLKPWVDWVLQDDTQRNCPYLYNSQSRACSWPSQLQLQLSESGGTFNQQWQVFDETLIRLPGDSEHWPQSVRSDSGELLVQSVNGMPYVKLPAGTHTILGLFRWSKLPKSLRVTPESGLIQLQVNNKLIEQPQFNQQGQLWLTQGSSGTVSEDNLDIQVFRKISDSHPVLVTTSIKLRVSGKQRNTTLSPVLLDEFTALSINSKLPARMEAGKDGQPTQLQVQLRPGEWTIEVTGRAFAAQTDFTLPVSKAPWPQQEVWVFEADTKMRQIEVSGVNSIDPSQTRLPSQWKSLPAYLLAPEQTLKLNEMHRGVSQVGQNELNLRREMWLDYDGKGYTIKDRLNGTIRQQSRLNATPTLELGRVSIDGRDQFITRESEGKAGVEIRRESINLNAESRYTGSRAQPPVNGWEHDLQSVNTTLHLPPGWGLFSATGTDNLPNSWVKNWSLLDFFLVLIIAISVAYLYNPLWGFLALVTLVFTWHEPNAPRYIWLNLLAAIALLRVLPDSWFKRSVNLYRWASLLALALILLPYTIDTIKTGLYPQLENRYGRVQVNNTGVSGTMSMSTNDEIQVEMAQDMSNDSMLQRAPEIAMKPRPKVSSSIVSKEYNSYAGKKLAPRKADLKSIDPNSMIQTGPGLPRWTGYKRINLSWSGPVKADETSRLMLINPFLNALIKYFGIALLLGLTWRLLSLNKGFSWNPKQWFKRSIVPALALCILPAMFMAPEPVQADTLPSEQMLQELKQRLTQAPECLPECAQIEQMQISIADNALQARLRVHAVIDTAIPLPGSQGTWLSQQVMVNGEPALAIQRDQSQQLWIAIPKGQSNVVLSGALPNRNSVPLPLPLKPHSVTWQSSDKDWTLDGIKDNGSTESQLQLNRVLSKDAKALREQAQSTLPTFVKIQRHLNLGLDWTVETTLTRYSPLDTPLSLNIPLLAGEQPMSEQLSIKNGRIKINLSAQQKQARWSSRLNSTDQLVLTATQSNDFLESWQVATSPVWHLKSSGIPVNQYRNQDQQTVPVWYPWPGESLTLDMSRPEGVAGQTVTILSSQMHINTGKRANNVTLTMNILSSRGVLHEIQLPKNADVKQLHIDGTAQRIQNTDNKLSLTLKPGKQTVSVEWRESDVLTTHYQFPEVNTGLPSVNANFTIKLPRDRWVLWVDGPTSGPAILFWGVLLALLILSLALAASKYTPLKSWQWFLLGIGLSQTETGLMILVILWLFAIASREKLTRKLSYAKFDLMQISLVGLTVVALGVLAAAVANGLLGSPDMQIVGNGSNAYSLNWYQDRAGEVLAQPSIVSVPLWIYRALMLAWALWLAMSVLGWLRWGWQAMNVGGLWMKRPVKEAGDDGRGWFGRKKKSEAKLPTTDEAVVPAEK
ncbi:hypothetical protein [Leucothrix pacifica]|uniref:hypothetical protein n=1 Tax=Leucothrix pacifica TaxID=1247513 RepID=UPI0015E8673F|nr:hypothetical protein [Leucothrix pacifica]